LQLRSTAPAGHWITPKSQILKNTEQKGAPKQRGKTTASRDEPNPRELKRAFLEKHSTKGSITFGTQKSQAPD
jgi:hypothetical protein